MYLHELLGKKVIRTHPKMTSDVDYHDRKLFMDTPIFIWAVTDKNAVYEHVEGFYKGEKKILHKEWMDNCWMDCEDLLELATQEHLDMMMNLTDGGK